MLAKVNGINLNYEWSGRNEGEVVLFSHALGSSLIMWRPQVAALEAKYRILRYDMRGHGGTDVPQGPYTLEQLGEDIISLLNVLKVDKIHYVGLSMGGMIGQYLGLAHPHRLHTLTISNTFSVCQAEMKRSLDERINISRNQGMKGLLQSTMERWFSLSFMQKNSADYQMIEEQFVKTPVEGFVGCCQAIQKLNYADGLPGITLPTLVMVGDRDTGTPVPWARAIHEKIKGSKFVIIPSAQHCSNVEQPEIFNANLLELLRAHK